MSTNDPFDKELCSLIENLLQQYHVPGLSVAVVDNGKTYARGLGLARFPATEAKPETLYFTGSTTKAMLAAALGVAIHNEDKCEFKTSDGKKLSWATPIHDVLGADFALSDSCNTKSTSIEDALSHRSGMSGHDNLYGPWLGSSPRELTKRLRHLGPPTQPFRTAFQYNNVMYAVAGDVLETLAGSACGDVLRDWLWKPLDMNQTFWHLQEVVDDSETNIDEVMSRGYYWSGKDQSQDLTRTGVYMPEVFVPFAGIAPAGATISSVIDYAKWMQALLDMGSELSGKKGGTSLSSHESPSNPLTSALFKDLSTPRITVPAKLPSNSQMMPATYSLGWMFPPTNLGAFHPLMHHGGGLTGYGTMLFLLPNDNFGVVTMGNTGGTSNIVGALVVQEIIVRRLRLKENGRVVKEAEMKQLETFIKSQISAIREEEAEPPLKDDLTAPADAEDQDTAKLKLSDFIRGDAGNLSEKLKSYEGVYKNVAYGELMVTFRSGNGADMDGAEKLGTDRIDYRFRKNRTEKNLIRSSTHSLQVTATGQRTWSFAWLLHPRKDKPAALAPSIEMKVQNEPVFFDQENLFLHGNVEDDVVPGIPTGCEGKGDSRCRQGRAWESVIWTKFGAAFVADHAKSSRIRLGMTLANELLDTGSGEVGWEQHMIWFDKGNS